MTLRDDRPWRVWFAAAVGLVTGLFVKLVAERRTRGLPDTISENVFTLRTLFALGAGVVVAVAVYSYLTIYADDPTFDANFGNLCA